MVLLSSVFELFCIMECCSDYWIPNNITELELRLNDQLIGQPLVHSLIVSSIRSHVSNPNPSKSLVLSLHGSTGTGKTFVAKHIVESLYREGYRSKYVQFYAVSRDFMYNDPAYIVQYKEHLIRDIEAKASTCARSIFVFDEIEQMPSQLLNVIVSYIDFHTPTSSRSTDFRKTIFIFLSNTGARSIIDLVKRNHIASIKRENYDILQFEQVLSNASLHETGGLQNAMLINEHLVSFFVPFLPLEREHIRGCIRQQLQRMLSTDRYQYDYSEDDVINRVLNLIPFKSLSSFEYSESGCKTVEQRLSYVFESLRHTFRRTEKPGKSFKDHL